MDLVQNGESSKSPRLDGDIVMGNDGSGYQSGASNLILPQWDVPPPRHLHSSHDLISLLHLDTLYNDYVRPYAEINPQDTEKGQQQHRRRKLEKGYWHLIDDCIDPTPTGTKLDNQSLLPITQDFMHPPGQSPYLYSEGIEMLPDDAFQVAKLEVGHKEDGYSAGVKLGVREAEEKRRRKKANKLSIKPNNTSTTPGIPSPSIGIPNNNVPGIPSPRPGSTPGTPLLPVLPPGHIKNNSFGRKPSLPNVQLGVKPFGPGPGQGKPYNPNKRPGSVEVDNYQRQGSKKFKSGSVGPSTSNIPYKPTGTGVAGSRSASPMPSHSHQGGQHGGQSGQSEQGGQSGQGQGLKFKIGMRSKTEGVQ
ncbi:hypothetical protein I204_04087 [Kwoniella mangroviensis CBS 8886]|nr:hypothetical protein I204_04087 [Kwoniella mangroviensis CBS 8886]